MSLMAPVRHVVGNLKHNDTLLLYEHHSILDHRYIDCLFNSFYGITASFTLLALCEGNPLVTSGFPSQMTNDVESISMAWRLHDIQVYSIPHKGNTILCVLVYCIQLLGMVKPHWVGQLKPKTQRFISFYSGKKILWIFSNKCIYLYEVIVSNFSLAQYGTSPS